MKTLRLALALCLALTPAWAQNFTMPPPAGVAVQGVVVVSGCGSQSLNPTQGYVTMDTTGKLCTSGAGAAATFGSSIGTVGVPLALDIANLAQPWFGNTAGGVNYGYVGVVDSTGTQLGGYPTGTWTVPSSSTISVVTQDPCSSGVKSSVAISVTSATTTSLVAVSGSTTVYACGYSFTIAPSATSADTALFEYGTGAACTSPTSLTGTYGNGDLTTAAPPTVVNYGGGSQTVFKSAASSGICLLTAGTTVNVQGVLTYVQQ